MLSSELSWNPWKPRLGSQAKNSQPCRKIRHPHRSHFAGPALLQLLQRSAQPRHLLKSLEPSLRCQVAPVNTWALRIRYSELELTCSFRPGCLPSRATHPVWQTLQSSIETHSAQNSPQSWHRPPASLTHHFDGHVQEILDKTSA